MLFNILFLVDDDTTSNFLNEQWIIKTKLVNHVRTFNYANIAFYELQQLTRNPDAFPDLILLDIRMPFMDGWQFLEEFQNLPQALLDKCSVYMCSASADSKDIEKSKTYKIVKGFIAKPLSIDKLKNLKNQSVYLNG